MARLRDLLVRRSGATVEAERLDYVNAYPFSMSVRWRLAQAYPRLDGRQRDLVLAALRQWFRLHVRARQRGQLAMPSPIVDEVWHDFMLHTQEYADFCERAFGRFLHHTPESARPGGPSAGQQSAELVRTLDLARLDEGGGGVPLLFRVDEDLGLGGGLRYVESCGARRCAAGAGVVCLAHVPAADRYAGGCGGSSGAASDGGGSDGASGGGCGGGCGGG